jgi:hypothetical protein
MPVRRPTAWLAFACVLCFAVDAAPADVITLNGGGGVQGKIVPSGNSKTVALRTSGGALIVFERQEVKNVKRAANPSQKTAAARRQLSPKEKAWMSKVHALLERAASSYPDQRRRATSDLLKINDENAIPALAHYLATSPNDESRRFFSTVLQSIPGRNAVYWLVQQSLLDPSPYVRDAARKAIGDRGDLARPLYIEVLKLRNPDLASLAAKGIAEIGDPNGESVPYLIDAMIFKTMREVVTSQPTKVMDADVLGAINLQNQLDAQSQAAASPPRISATAPGRSGEVVMGGNALGNSNISQFPLEGPMNIPVFTGRKGLTTFSGTSLTAPVTMWDIMNTPLQYSTKLQREKSLNEAVHDTLVHITGQQLGNNPGTWRRWWLNQLKNRALEKPKTGDRVIPKSTDSSPDSSDTPRPR